VHRILKEIRVRLFFKLVNPTPVQTPAAVINPTLIYPCFCLRNYHTDSWSCRNLKVTPVIRFYQNFDTGSRSGPKEKRRILPESTPVIRIRAHLWYQHMIIAAGLTLVAKNCTLHGAFWLPGLADYPLRSGCAKNTLWVVALCSMNMSQQYFGEINWGFSFSMQFFEAVQLLKPKFLSLQLVDHDH